MRAARLFDRGARLAAGGVQLRRVAGSLAEVRQHRLEDPRVDRRRRGVIEVDGRHAVTASEASSSRVIPASAPRDRRVKPAPDGPRGTARRPLATAVVGNAADQAQRTLDGGDHVAGRDRRRRPGQPIAAAGAARGGYEAGVAQACEDPLQEGCRQALGGRDLGQRRRIVAVARGEEHHGAQPVLAARGDLHAALQAEC